MDSVSFFGFLCCWGEVVPVSLFPSGRSVLHSPQWRRIGSSRATGELCGSGRLCRVFCLGAASGVSIVLAAAFVAAFFMTKSGFDRWQWLELVQILTLF